MNLYRKIFEELDDYRGSHQAPRDDGYNSPLYDVTLNGTYPDDIYSSNAVRYYGDGIINDREFINIIQSMRNNPKGSVAIYRAIPDFDYETNRKIKEINNALSYYYKYNFYPSDDKGGFEYFHFIESRCDEELRNTKISYDDRHEYIQKACVSEIDTLNKNKGPKIKINKGDWVTINKKYAIDHGKSALNGKYKIISKKVKANQLWTDGNSIHEFGYD